MKYILRPFLAIVSTKCFPLRFHPVRILRHSSVGGFKLVSPLTYKALQEPPEHDERDAEIARQRIAELQQKPEQIISGAALQERLTELEK